MIGRDEELNTTYAVMSDDAHKEGRCSDECRSCK